MCYHAEFGCSTSNDMGYPKIGTRWDERYARHFTHRGIQVWIIMPNLIVVRQKPLE